MNVTQPEFLDVTIPGQGAVPRTPVYAGLPPGARRGAVVIHELAGRQPEIDRVVRRFAARGYAAVAPDLMASSLLPICLVRAMQAMRTGQGPQIEQIRTARDWLCERTGIAADHVGIIGFCLGGGFALAAGSGFGAVSTNYGDLPPAKVLRGCGPVIGCYGGRDRLFGGKGQELEHRLRPLGVEVETHVFPEVGHSFLTDGHHPIAKLLTQPLMHITYNPEVAERAWQLIFAFFDKHLG